MGDCKQELNTLLQEDVTSSRSPVVELSDDSCQRLAGASLLIFANKQDIKGALTSAEIRAVSPKLRFVRRPPADPVAGSRSRRHQVPPVVDRVL
jgi:hypothetical protein